MEIKSWEVVGMAATLLQSYSAAWQKWGGKETLTAEFQRKGGLPSGYLDSPETL